MKYLTRRFANRTVLIYIIFVLFTLTYNEVYLYYSHKWNQLECKEKCTRLLLVADPQLIGPHEEVIHFLTPISIWDSDRYLQKTYQKAFQFAKPDVVIFLGDLFDEGSKVTEEEYKLYTRRFFDVFDIPSNNAKNIFLPGDNDIGGEGYELVRAESILNFDTSFLQPDVLNVDNITFYKVNRLTRTWPRVKGEMDFYKMDNIRVALSHVPLIFQPSGFSEKVIGNLQPQLIFAAHQHNSMIVSMDGMIQTDRQIVPITQRQNAVHTYALGIGDMYEVVVPTCSYRMGTKRIGYGFATIESGELNYTVLWSPSRFDQLLNYFWVLAVTLLYLVYRCFVRKCRCCKPALIKRSI